MNEYMLAKDVAVRLIAAGHKAILDPVLRQAWPLTLYTHPGSSTVITVEDVYSKRCADCEGVLAAGQVVYVRGIFGNPIKCWHESCAWPKWGVGNDYGFSVRLGDVHLGD